MNNCTSLSALLLLLSVFVQQQLTAQSNLSLQLETEKSTLLRGEAGMFSLIITNNDTVEINDISVAFTFQKDFTIIDSSDVWSLENLAVGASDTLQFTASSSGYAQFIAEVVSPNNDILVGRCFSSNCYPDDNLKCYYTNCEREADEVLYPVEFAAVEITNVECSPTGEIGCGRNYNIIFVNPSATTSAPLNLFMRAFFGEAEYQQTGTTFFVPSIPANDSLTLMVDFGDCIEDRPFATVHNLQLGLVASNVISLFADGRQTAPESAFVDLVNTSRCRYNNTTDIAIQATTDGIINVNNTATYQVSITNNGDEIAESLQITYGRNISRGPGDSPLIEFDGTSDYAMSSFSEDEESRARFLDYDKYWNVQNLASGETAVLEVTAMVAESFVDNFSTNISVNENSFLTDPNLADNSTSIEFTRPQAADVALSVATDRPDIAQYERGIFTYTLTNNGNVDATGVTVQLYYGSDVVPVGEAMVTTSSGEYFTLTDSLTENTGVWQNVAIPANSTATLQIELFSLVSDLSFCAAVTAMEQEDSDSNPQMNCGAGEDDEAIFTAASPFIDLELAAVIDESTVFPNAQRLTFSIFNNSTTAATDVQVAVDLDETLTGVVDTFYISSHGGSYDPAAGTWTIANLPAYNTAQLVMYVNATTETFTVFSEVAAADQMDEDSTPANGTCCTPNEDDEAVINDTNPFLPNDIQRNTRSISATLIFPNPTREILHLGNYQGENIAYEIIDLFGKVVQRGTLDQNEINVRPLANGTYFLKLANANAPTRFVKM